MNCSRDFFNILKLCNCGTCISDIIGPKSKYSMNLIIIFETTCTKKESIKIIIIYMYNDINSALIFLAITRNVYIKKSGHAHVQDNQTKTVYLFFQTALD